MQKSLLNVSGLFNTEIQIYDTQYNNTQVMYKDPAGTSQRQHYKSITEAGENRQ
jgi:hypothetical protein